ncbi:MAG: cell division protein ZapA [Rhodobacteraceae bacterium]|jgi:cell division protein ZapA|nr:cell division protein ZapA [Paracoccaceae bacterium]
MPDVTITIGGRDFDVACQAGEEHYLRSAAQLLDIEAQAMAGQAMRLPESRMLLMAGLMLADKTAGLEEQLRDAENRMARMAAELETLRGAPADPVEVPVIPPEVLDLMTRLAERIEDMADQATERLAS